MSATKADVIYLIELGYCETCWQRPCVCGEEDLRGKDDLPEDHWRDRRDVMADAVKDGLPMPSSTSVRNKSEATQ